MLEAESVENERGGIFNAIMNQSIALTLFHMLDSLKSRGHTRLRPSWTGLGLKGMRSKATQY